MSILDDIQNLYGDKKKAPPSTTETLPKPAKRILIVEDEPMLLEMYRDKFLHEGFEIISAQNGEEGLEKITSQKPQLVLLDLMMPVMDGKTMLRKMREMPEFKKLPVIILTNAGEVENIKETQFYDNANEFLIKSNISVDDLVEKVKFWT